MSEEMKSKPKRKFIFAGATGQAVFFPDTLEHVKRLAKKIKKANRIKHHVALELAAVELGFKDFKDAREHYSKKKENKMAKRNFVFVGATGDTDYIRESNGRRYYPITLDDKINEAPMKHCVPKTLEHVKRRAEKVEKITGCQHHEALDYVAAEFVFKDFKDARECYLQNYC